MVNPLSECNKKPETTLPIKSAFMHVRGFKSTGLSVARQPLVSNKPVPPVLRDLVYLKLESEPLVV